MADRTIAVALRADTGQYEQSMRRAGTSTMQAGTAATGTQRAMGGLGMAARRLIPILGIAGVARSAGQAVTAAVNLESRLFSMQTQIGLTSSEVQRFSNEFGRLGSETGIAGQELADASWQIASAGLRGADALDTLESAARASAVGFGEVNTIAGLTSAAVNAYGSDVLTAAEATDVLAAAVRSGTAAPEELASTMGSVLPIASEMGVSFAEIGAAQAAMTRTGTDAATSITQLRGILSMLLNPAEGSAKAMAEVGLSAEGLRATIREDGLWEALMSMRDAIGDNEDALGRMIPNQRALAGFLDLTGANAEANAQVFADLAGATGLVDEAFEEWGSTTEAQLAKAGANWQNFKTNVADGAIPALNAALETLNATMTGIGSGGEGVSTFGEDLSGPERVAGFFRDIAGLNFTDAADSLGVMMGAMDVTHTTAFRDSLSDVTFGADAAEEAFLAANGQLDVHRTRSDSAAAGADGLSSSLDDVDDSANDTRTSIERLSDALTEHTRIHLDAESAAIRVEEGFSDLTGTLNENGATLDRNTEKGRENERAIIDQAGAILDEVEARHRQGDSIGDILPLYDRQVERLREVMSQADMTEEQIDAYIETLGLTPEQIVTDVIAETGQATSLVDSFIRATGRIPRNITTTVSVQADMSAYNRAIAESGNRGQVPRLHTGGRIGMSGQIERFGPASNVSGGLRSDEVPAILQTGEVVLSRAQVSMLAGVVGSRGQSPQASAVGTSAPNVKVFIGDTELRGMVRVELDGAVGATRSIARAS